MATLRLIAAGPWEEAREEIRRKLSSPSKGVGELAKEVAHAHGLPRRAVYTEAMKIKAELNESGNGNDYNPNDGTIAKEESEVWKTIR